MFSNRTSRTRGFTLVEILIVVIILGILAAIVIPQFVGASQTARQSSLASQLGTVRSQIEFYKVQHGDALPNLLTNWDAMTATSVYPTGSSNTFGPYLQAVPTNSLNTLSSVVDGVYSATPLGSSAGFVYDYNSGSGTGRIWGTDTDGKTITNY